MISIKKSLSFAAVILAMTLMGTAVMAQDDTTKSGSDQVQKKERKERRMRREGFAGRRGKRAMRGHRGIVRGLSRLDLSEEQKTQIKTLMETTHTANKPAMEEMRSLMMKRREGTMTEADKERVQTLRQGMKDSHEQLRATVLGLLTPEQTAKLDQMKAERQEKMERRKQRMRERKESHLRRKEAEEKAKETPPSF